MCYHNLSLSLYFIHIEKGNRSLAFEPSALNVCFLEHKLIFREAHAWNYSAETDIYSDIVQLFNRVGIHLKYAALQLYYWQNFKDFALFQCKIVA